MSSYLMILVFGQIWIVGVAAAFIGLGQVKLNYIRDPNYWLAGVSVAILPLLMACILVAVRVNPPEVFSVMMSPIAGVSNVAPDITTRAFNPWLWGMVVYALVSIFGLTRLYLGVRRLRRIADGGKRGAGGIRIVDADITPCALGWPNRCILLPKDLIAGISPEAKGQLIAHEAAHIARRDPEMTLGLLALQNLFWINPGIRVLIARWRFAAEIRADQAVTQNASAAHREAYAEMLLEFTRRQSAMPCPSINFTLTQKRSLHMRLAHIITPTSPLRKSAKLLGGAAILFAGLGSLSLAAFAADSAPSSDRDAQPLTRVPPMMPASCPGLDVSGLKIEEKSYGKAARIGTVKVKFDVTASGTPSNISITDSNHDCFSKAAKKSVEKWTYEPNAKNGVQAMIVFMLTSDTIEADARNLAQ